MICLFSGYPRDITESSINMDKLKMQNEYLFIGAIADAEIVQLLNSKGCKVSTGYNVQRKMIEGLEKLGHYSDTITGHISPPLARDTLIVDYKSKNRNENVTDVSVSFLNLPLIDKLIKKVKIGIAAKHWIKRKKNPKIFVYSLTSSFLLGALQAKRKNTNCKIVTIVPDLPEFMSNSNNKIYRLLKGIDGRILDRCLKKVDALVLFSEYMREKLPVQDKPFVVVEGIIQDVNHEEYMNKIEKRANNLSKTIMLTGALDYEEGILTLLEAFSKIEDREYKLWLTGTGNAVDLINKYADADKRIAYFGYIASYDEFLELQQKASVFVLMVPPTHPKAAYYFPSKLMEYLATGGIVACYKLPCIPDEYDEYLQYFSGDAEQIGRQLTDLCKTDPEVYREMAIKRYEFIKQKNSVGQMKKVEKLVDMLQ